MIHATGMGKVGFVPGNLWRMKKAGQKESGVRLESE